MTAVLRIETINFATLNRGGEIIKGIDDGGMYGLLKHNNRTEYNTNYEVKSKRTSNIDKSKSKYNHYFKRLTSKKIETLKNIPHRKNQVGAFQMVFDFQDLTDSQKEKFKNEKHAKSKLKMILVFLKQQGVLEKFNLLEAVLHNDEPEGNPHIHLCFSAIDNNTNSWGYNEHFSPIVGKEIVKKNGIIQYQKHNRGKFKGKYKLDTNGNKIAKTQAVRANIIQKLQDDWDDFLLVNNLGYRNKKEYSSILQFPKSLWRRFDESLKEKIYAIRKRETLLNQLKDKDSKRYEALKKELAFKFYDVINEIEYIKSSPIKKL